MFKDILTHEYAQFFVGGFSLQNFDAKLAHLNRENKTQMLGHVIAALDLDLRHFASTGRDKDGSPSLRPTLPDAAAGSKSPVKLKPAATMIKDEKKDDDYSDDSFNSEDERAQDLL